LGKLQEEKMPGSSVRIIAARETLFFSHHAGELCQWLELRLENKSGQVLPGLLHIRAPGKETETILAIAPGQGQYRGYAPLLWPEVPGAKRARLRLEIGKDALQMEIDIGRFRPWTVYLLSDVCSDYLWAYDSVEASCADDAALLKAELDVADQMVEACKPNRNHYNLVHAREVDFFLQHYPDQVERLIDHFRRGTLTLNPVFNMTLFGDMSLEEIIRSFYPARRLARQHGLDDRYANIQETPTAAWVVATLLAGSGVKHMLRSLLPYEAPWARRLEEPPMYFWEGPDGSRVLVRLRNQDYVEGAFVLKGVEATNQALHQDTLPRYEALGERYPFDALGLVGCYGDLALNSPELPALKAATVAAYNAQGWEYPRLVNASHKQFWDDIDAQIEKKKIQVPVLRGDYGTSWEAWPACLAYDFAGWRRAQERAATADRLAAILSQLDPAWYAGRRAELEQGWLSLLSLADHAWNGASDGNREVNARLRRTWQLEANRTFDHLIASGMARLAKRIPTGPQGNLLAFNALGWERDSLVWLDQENLSPPPSGEDLDSLDQGNDSALSLIDPLDSKPLPMQWVEEGDKKKLCFLARGVPSLGYRTYSFERQAQPPGVDNRMTVQANILEGPFYRLEIDPATGAVRSLFDKIRQRELVDPESVYGLNEPVYHSVGKASPKPFSYQLFQGLDTSETQEYRARLVSLAAGSRGPVLGELVVHTAIPNPAAGEIRFTTSYRLYADLDRLDICNQVDKPVSSEKQELDFVFPFNVPKRQYRYEAPGAVITPGEEQRPGSGQAVTALRHFVDVFNADFGVTLSMADSGLVEFGHRTTGEDPLSPDPSNSTLLAVALENCFDWNEAIRDQGGVRNFTFRFSLRGHAGGFDPLEAVHFAGEDNNELVTKLLPPGQKGDLPSGAHSFVSVSPANLILTGCKPAEQQGLAIRIWNLAGQETQAVVDASGLGQLKEALRTDLLESEMGEAKIEDGKACLPVSGRGFAAARLTF
jgi:hypothetical protein